MAVEKKSRVDMQPGSRPIGETLDENLSAIADIDELPMWMDHIESADCWCKPVVRDFGYWIHVQHKDPAKGEFDT
jgi:hypothetical protein